MPSISEDTLEREILVCLNERALTFDELRACLESKGMYVDGLTLRSLVSKMLRADKLFKIPNEKRRKLLLRARYIGR